MNKLTFDAIDELVEVSQFPLDDRYIELGNEKGEPYYRFLYHVVGYLNPKNCLEIGVGWGLGSAHMCRTSHGHVIGVDMYTTALIGGLMGGYGNYHFIGNDSTDIGTQKMMAIMVKEYGQLGVIFQDSSHHYEASCKEWEIYSQFLDDNAIWICDDIMPAFQRPSLDEGSMVDYFEQLPGEKKLYDNLHHGSVMGVILT